MAENSNISWTDHTFNPWMGCTKVSPACDNCYAETLMDTRYGRVSWGPGEDRVLTGKSNWAKPRKWNRDAAAAGTRPFVFCASLADVFDNEVDEMWRYRLWRLIEETPHLVWLLLTKRIGNVVKMTSGGTSGWLDMKNVAIGATMATKAEYDRDAWKLDIIKHEMKPLFTFGSFEPLLENVRLHGDAPDWIIVGGESGAKYRHMEQRWALDLQSDAEMYNRVFHYKQDGGRDGGGHLLGGIAFDARPAVPEVAHG
jgi:protein gp37